jgi:hypothetical protein
LPFEGYPPPGLPVYNSFSLFSLRELISANSSYEKGYRQIRPNKGVIRSSLLPIEKSPVYAGLFALSFNYSDGSITNTPRECAGLARGFAIQGLDRILLCETAAAARQFRDGGFKDGGL